MQLPDSTSFGYSNDAADRLTSLQNPSGQTWNWSYLNNDWLSQQTDASRVTVNCTHNARGILTILANTTTSGGSTLSSYTVNGFVLTGMIVPLIPENSTQAFRYEQSSRIHTMTSQSR